MRVELTEKIEQKKTMCERLKDTLEQLKEYK
jgi:hypothetical protein